MVTKVAGDEGEEKREGEDEVLVSSAFSCIGKQVRIKPRRGKESFNSKPRYGRSSPLMRASTSSLMTFFGTAPTRLVTTPSLFDMKAVCGIPSTLNRSTSAALSTFEPSMVTKFTRSLYFSSSSLMVGAITLQDSHQSA